MDKYTFGLGIVTCLTICLISTQMNGINGVVTTGIVAAIVGVSTGIGGYMKGYYTMPNLGGR